METDIVPRQKGKREIYIKRDISCGFAVDLAVFRRLGVLLFALVTSVTDTHIFPCCYAHVYLLYLDWCVCVKYLPSPANGVWYLHLPYPPHPPLGLLATLYFTVLPCAFFLFTPVRAHCVRASRVACYTAKYS